MTGVLVRIGELEHSGRRDTEAVNWRDAASSQQMLDMAISSRSWKGGRGKDSPSELIEAIRLTDALILAS